jgi:N-acetylneuraminic acid mutarotase
MQLRGDFSLRHPLNHLIYKYMKKFRLPLLVIVLASLGAVTAQAQSSIVLNPERAGHGATLLNSGKVLITGGVNESATLNSALLYNPATGTIVPTGSMTSARASHTSTLLTDGRVLVTGGVLSNNQQLRSAEIYDPATGIFTQVSRAMSNPRSKHTATLLPDGRVLVIGGKNADLFDPVTQTFTATTSRPVNRTSHATVVLADGSILITGGYLGPKASNSAEIYNPATQTFTVLAATMRVPRANHAMTRLFDGTVLITGGFSGTSPHDEVEIFDPVQQTFTAGTSMLFHRSNHDALLLTNGKVLVIGGTTKESGFLAINEIYDPASQNWSIHDTMVENRSGHTSTLLGGNILVAGGVTGSRTLQTAEMLDPSTMTFTSVGNMTLGRNQHSDTLLPDGKVLLAGGSTDAVILDSAEVFDPANNSFAAVGSMKKLRKSHTATRLEDGHVLVTGGKSSDVNGGDLSAAELYDPLTMRFSSIAPMNQGRSQHTATLLNDGKVLLAAGRKGGDETDTAELYDPASALFSYTGSLSLKRKRHRASLLLDGTVLVSGGATFQNAHGAGEEPTDTAELFHPATGTFTHVQKMHYGRDEHESTLLPDGTVLITGGNLDVSGEGDVYQPGTQSFLAVGIMVQKRLRHVAILLSNPAWGSLVGKVLVIGGSKQGSPVFGGLRQALDSVELYNPATGQFSTFGTMTVERQNHTATQLLDGRILITGGVGRPFVSGTAELVTP